jgi:hypothetical protein
MTEYLIHELATGMAGIRGKITYLPPCSHGYGAIAPVGPHRIGAHMPVAIIDTTITDEYCDYQRSIKSER